MTFPRPVNRTLPPMPPLKVVTQLVLGESLRCGDASLTEVMRQASRGMIDIPEVGARAKLRFWDEIRERGNIPRGGGSQIIGLEAAFESYAPDFRKQGLSPPQMRKLNPGNWSDVIGWLRKGPEHLVLFGEFYGTFNWLIKGTSILSGQPGLRSDHWTALKGVREGPIKQSDPLADGRRAGIAKGPQDIPPRILRLAAGAWDKLDTQPIGAGRVIAGLVRASTWLDQEPEPTPEPPPPKPTPKPDDLEPLDPCAQLSAEHARLYAEYGELRDENSTTLRDNAALEAQLTAWRGWARSHPDDPTETGAEPAPETGVDPEEDA